VMVRRLKVEGSEKLGVKLNEVMISGGTCVLLSTFFCSLYCAIVCLVASLFHCYLFDVFRSLVMLYT